MDTTTLIWIIAGVVALALIVVVVLLVTARGRRDRRAAAQHDKAERLREEAHESELTAREHEAQIAQARADAASATAAAEQAKARAAQASIDAERHAGTIDEHVTDATKHREEQMETLRKADEVDPYVADDRADAAPRVDADADVRRDDLDTNARTAGPADEPLYREPPRDEDLDDPAARRSRADRV